MSDQIQQLSIKALLSGKDEYVIPMYQRNYAWEEGEITQLIQDVIDYLPKQGDSGSNYYIGSLVVYERPDTKTPVFETIDGQQRLTTLSLLTSYLKNTKALDLAWYSSQSIHFDSREHSRATFTAIFDGKFNDDPAEVLTEKQINTGILNGYRLIQRILPQKLRENNVSPQQFAEYLFGFVQIMRVKVPADTDLNHYFEIMNNRGEQLEKHEVLKARMMAQLNKITSDVERAQSQNCLHTVWEACANMERYVQMGFTPSQRSSIFGKEDWGQFIPTSFDELTDKLHCMPVVAYKEGEPLTLDQIIANAPAGAGQANTVEEAPERFNTVINFPNFLLHVLRVDTQKDIPLDDKRLLDTFETHVFKQSDPIAAVKRFIFSLLRCKYLFDQYVIKREFIKGADGWSLKRFKRFKRNDGDAGRGSYVNTFGDEEGSEGINRRILMLLSAFHVSTPTLVYKHWLNAALHYLFHAKQVEAQAFLQHMESVAKAFVFDRFLAPAKVEYFEMIYRNEGECRAIAAAIDEKALNFGNIENNLVFNFLDYLLWLEHRANERVKHYEFTFRSSVEHYYPQKPLPGHALLDADTLNSFGNLCLISHDKNSRLSNFMPAAKKEFYQNNTIDSVKQYLMMKEKSWDASAIREHYKKMKDVLLNSLTSKHETSKH